MVVSHRYRRFALRGPRIVMRARRGAASRLSLALASALQNASSSINTLKLFAPPGATSGRPHAFYGPS